MLLLMPLAFKTYSQDEKISLGVKGGLNIASISGLNSASSSWGGTSSSVSNPPRLLPHLGIFSEIKIASIVSFQPEILFSMKGYHTKSKSSSGSTSSEFDDKVTLSYIDVPLQLRFNIGKGFNILAGPYVGFLMGASDKSTSIVTNGTNSTKSENNSSGTDGFNKSQVGLNLGVGYQFENGLNIGATWNKGFSKVYNAYTNTSNVFQISVAYRLAKF